MLVDYHVMLGGSCVLVVLVVVVVACSVDVVVSGLDVLFCFVFVFVFFLQAEGVIRCLVRSRGLGDVYKRQTPPSPRARLG